jgi:uncharacterized protein YbjT (DUF2867 family)
MYLVTGITGRVGGAAAKNLLAHGKKVRAIVRTPRKAATWAAQGVEIIEGDWNDAAALTKALAGVEGAYLMMPPIMTPSPDFSEAKAVAAAYTEALKNAPPPRVVALSSIGSEKTEKLGLITGTHIMEEALKQFTFPIAFVRAGSFMENFLYGLQSGQGGVLPIMYTPTDREVPMIATKDIGDEVAKLLTTDWTGLRIIELGTPLTPDSVATQIGQVIGREVKAHGVPRDQWAEAFESQGFPRGSTGAYEEMLDSFNNGWISFGVEGTESVQGPTTPKQVFAEAHKFVSTPYES